jgi:hypothetical protein
MPRIRRPPVSCRIPLPIDLRLDRCRRRAHHAPGPSYDGDHAERSISSIQTSPAGRQGSRFWNYRSQPHRDTPTNRRGRWPASMRVGSGGKNSPARGQSARSARRRGQCDQPRPAPGRPVNATVTGRPNDVSLADMLRWRRSGEQWMSNGRRRQLPTGGHLTRSPSPRHPPRIPHGIGRSACLSSCLGYQGAR